MPENTNDPIYAQRNDSDVGSNDYRTSRCPPANHLSIAD